MNLSKTDMIARMADQAGITKAQAQSALEAFTSGVAEACKADGKVGILGFGTFTLRKTAAREGRNPKTGETIKIAAGRTVGFKVGKALKESV